MQAPQTSSFAPSHSTSTSLLLASVSSSPVQQLVLRPPKNLGRPKADCSSLRVTGYTVTGSLSLVAAKRAVCFHNNAEASTAPCSFDNNPWMIFFGALQIWCALLCPKPPQLVRSLPSLSRPAGIHGSQVKTDWSVSTAVRDATMYPVLCSFSQIPDFGGLWWLSYLATIMSICYVRPSGHACSPQKTHICTLLGRH